MDDSSITLNFGEQVTADNILQAPEEAAHSIWMIQNAPAGSPEKFDAIHKALTRRPNTSQNLTAGPVWTVKGDTLVQATGLDVNAMKVEFLTQSSARKNKLETAQCDWQFDPSTGEIKQLPKGSVYRALSSGQQHETPPSTYWNEGEKAWFHWSPNT